MIRAQDQTIQSLVADIRDGKLLLPEMQRRYVWKAVQARDLFDSLYHEYPSGQLLVWETDELPAEGNRIISVDGISIEQRRPLLLLDGQQRLTSLAAIMLGQPLRVRDVLRPIDIAFNVYTEKFEVAGPRQSAQNGWISVSSLFTKGMISVFKDLTIDLKTPEASDVLAHLNRLDGIKNYKYRVNVLERLSYAEVTHIFVRTNSGGTTLGYSDLALAQVSSSWQGVTKEFEKYQKHLKAQGLKIELDDGLLLRAIVVLLTKQTRFTRFFKGDHPEITTDKLKDAWERAKTALDRSLSFLSHNCLIDRLEMLPTRSVLMPLVAFFDRNVNISNKQLRQLQRWVYMALIWTRYSSSSETAMDQDIAALDKEDPIHAMIQNIENVVGSGRPITENELKDQRKNSPYMLLSYVLARHANAQDWFSGVVINNNHHSELVLHHIFPKPLLSKRYKLREESRLIDQVANLVFLASPPSKVETNLIPADYLPAIDVQRLKAQHIPLETELWAEDQFEEFMRQRRKMLANALNQFLSSLTDEEIVWLGPGLEILERRISDLEQLLRHLVENRLTEARGESAWEHLIPKDIQGLVNSRIKKEENSKPYTKGQHETIEAKLKYCQFSDYKKIVKENWALFEDVFGKIDLFDQYSGFVINTRNLLKHGNEPGNVDLAFAEGGLQWIEECLDHVNLDEENNEEALLTGV